MIPWTTPTHIITVKEADLSGADVYVDYRQGSKTLHIKADTVTYSSPDTTITVELTQQQTGAFRADSPVEVQVNWITSDGKRDATVLKQLDNRRNLYERVLDYGL